MPLLSLFYHTIPSLHLQIIPIEHLLVVFTDMLFQLWLALASHTENKQMMVKIQFMS